MDRIHARYKDTALVLDELLPVLARNLFEPRCDGSCLINVIKSLTVCEVIRMIIV